MREMILKTLIFCRIYIYAKHTFERKTFSLSHNSFYIVLCICIKCTWVVRNFYHLTLYDIYSRWGLNYLFYDYWFVALRTIILSLFKLKLSCLVRFAESKKRTFRVGWGVKWFFLHKIYVPSILCHWIHICLALIMMNAWFRHKVANLIILGQCYVSNLLQSRLQWWWVFFYTYNSIAFTVCFSISFSTIYSYFCSQ